MYRKQKKIPTLLGLFILFVGITGTIYFDRYNHNITSTASVPAKIEDVHFSNISSSSFTITWLTEIPTSGYVQISGENMNSTLIDDLDNDSIPRTRTTHYITVKNLKENSAYNIKIFSGNNCSVSENCPSFTQNTLLKESAISALPPIHGILNVSENKPADSAIIYVVIGNSLPLSARTDSSGLWVVPLLNLRSQNSNEKLTLSDIDLVQISASMSPSQKSTAVIDVKSIRQNLAIPQIQLGNSYNFIDLLSKKGMLANSQTQSVLGVQTGNNNSVIDILFPLIDNDVTFDSQPRFRGIGPKGKEILITINSIIQTGKTVAENDGTWSWRPTSPLSPGNHSITIGFNNNGQLLTVSKKFIVLKSGEQVLGDATVSASLTPTKTASPTATLAPTTPTPTPTLKPTSTPVPTIIPTTVATIPPIAPPRTGTAQPLFIIMGIGGLLFGIGAKLLFFP